MIFLILIGMFVVWVGDEFSGLRGFYSSKADSKRRV